MANLNPFSVDIPPYLRIFDAVFEMYKAKSRPDFLITNVSGFKDNSLR